MRKMEIMLLKMWKDNGVDEIYKYKGRIKFFREPLTNIDLFYDMTFKMFQDVEDISSHSNSSPAEYKKSVDTLIQNRL